jgi:hypothetical protein
MYINRQRWPYFLSLVPPFPSPAILGGGGDLSPCELRKSTVAIEGAREEFEERAGELR